MKTILILEDDLDILELIKLILDKDYEIHCFDTIEAINKSEQFINSCDLIITDYLIKNKTCLELIKKFPHKTYLIISAYSDIANEIDKYTPNTKIKYMKKPFGIEKLKETIKQLI